MLLKIEGETTAVDEESAPLPAATILYQCYPNPFNSSTTIKYQLASDAEVKLSIYNLLGRKVADLVDTRQRAGEHEVRWDATDCASGVYFYKLTTRQGPGLSTADDRSFTRRMVLLK